MSQNKFLNNIHQKGATPSSSPVETQAVSASSPPVSNQDRGPTDPISRLTEALSQQNQLTQTLIDRFDVWEQRPRGSTPQELTDLMAEARKGVRYTPDVVMLANALLPALTKDMPSLANLQGSTEAGVNAIQAAGIDASERVEKACSRAVARMESAGRSRSNVVAGRIGFSSWQSALLLFGGFLVVVIGAMLANQQREAALAQSRTETQAVREFTNWVKTQPEGKRLYERYYNP